MHKIIITTLAAALWLLPAPTRAQNSADKIGQIKEMNRTIDAIPLRTEFISYDLRENAEKGARNKNQYYRELELTSTPTQNGVLFTAETDIPVLWLDRVFLLHADGLADGTDIMVNNNKVAQAHPGIFPEEIDITAYITDGPNRIEFEQHAPADAAPQAFIYSQPRIRVEDFQITVEPDSLYTEGRIYVRYALANGYNFPETINVGYDIYDPKGKLKHFDNLDVVVPGNGRDTLTQTEPIYGMKDFMWTAENPALYNCMIVVQHGRRYTEYIPFRVGFGTTEVVDGTLVRNGRPVDIEAVRYNAAADQKTTADELARLKKAGINTILVDYPQPFWFYDLTDEKGFYVFDQPDFNYGTEYSGERTPGGTPANDPERLGDYMYRTKAMFARSRNHPSIVGWSLGDRHGNGYNLYKTYQWLKRHEPSRAVIYNGADGEWNTDMAPIPARDAREILEASGR